MKNSAQKTRCPSCNFYPARCICIRYESVHNNSSQSKEASFDAFLVCMSLLFGYWIYLKNFSKFFVPLPILIAYVLIKTKFFCLYDSVLLSFLLKICRFLFFHYRLISFLILLSFLGPFFKFTVIVFILVLAFFYLVAKYINQQAKGEVSQRAVNNNNNNFNFDNSSENFNNY